MELSTNFTLCCSTDQNKTDSGQIPLLPFSPSPLDQRFCSAPSRQRWRFPDALSDDVAELKLLFNHFTTAYEEVVMTSYFEGEYLFS